MLVAGDVGGTKTLLGVFGRGNPRPAPQAVHSYATASFASFADILDAFARDVNHPLTVEAVALGVAGPVVDNRAMLTNVGLEIGAMEIGARFGTRRTRLLNDLEAMASSIEVLTADELTSLQDGVPHLTGSRAVIAAGTGLGQAYLHRVDGGWQPVPTEAGHADFAARTDRELELVRMLRERYGRAEVEQVISGPGLLNVHRFTHRGGECPVVSDLDAPEAPALVSQAALGGRCQHCAEALRMFVSAYGAEAGNLALRTMATGGVYIGGGIARKILPALTNGNFIDAFRAKEPLSALVARIPVYVILNEEAGLLGAAVSAQRL
ncbi:MAG TPA: glucokinase [Vicinamibacterales bacterium]|nr:glucokinase [Vicinamibacterales bacterium]